jgi:hypothetical protein
MPVNLPPAWADHGSHSFVVEHPWNLRIQLHYVAIMIFALPQRRFSLLAGGDIDHGHGDADHLARFVESG